MTRVNVATGALLNLNFLGCRLTTGKRFRLTVAENGAGTMFPIQNTVASRYPPVVTWALIAANCAVFLISVGMPPAELDDFISRFALIPARYFSGDAHFAPTDFLPFFTMMFLHGGWLHLILNMWTLWLFGRPVEDQLGSFRYLVFYCVCGVVAGLVHCTFNPASPMPVLGASGAIAGVLGCYVRFFPLSRLIVVVPILFLPLFFEVPAILFVGIWFLLQLMQGTAELFTPATGADIAWWAHVGGFISGLILGSLLIRPKREHRPFYADEGLFGFDPSGRP